jgi:exodeoxyribonuclease X
VTVIRVVDIETTGLEPTAQVCEIGYCDVISDAVDDHGKPIWFVAEGTSTLTAITVPMPPEVSAIHHIVDEDLASAPLLADVAKVIFQRPEGRPFYLAAHNCKFERQYLTPEFTGDVEWICTYKAACRIWPDAPGHTNQTLRYWRKPPGLVREKAGAAHRAFGDAYVTAFLLAELLQSQNVGELVTLSNEPALLTNVSFGKYQGKRWSDVPTDYLQWMLGQDFDEDRLFTAQHHIAARRSA